MKIGQVKDGTPSLVLEGRFVSGWVMSDWVRLMLLLESPVVRRGYINPGGDPKKKRKKKRNWKWWSHEV